MDLITRANFMGAAGVSTGETLDSTTIGDAANGGYFGGYISHTANGIATHALIISPASLGYGNGYTSTGYQLANSTTAYGGTSDYDGVSNTDLMVANLSGDMITYISNLSSGGYDDWYIPAVYELQIAYHNLKPSDSSTYPNDTNFGSNPYSVPTRSSNYTYTNPPQTSLTAWQDGGSQAFALGTYGSIHWSSTQSTSNTNNNQALRFYRGDHFGTLPRTFTSGGGFALRPFRRIAL